MKVYKSELPEIILKYKKGGILSAKITSSLDLHDLMLQMFNADTIEYREEVIALFLNGANKTIGWIKHSAGGTANTVVDVSMLLATALKCGATCLVIAHNHPSGQNRPSREDDKVTQRVKEGCAAVGIRFLDHLIMCPDNGYYSFCDEGKI